MQNKFTFILLLVCITQAYSQQSSNPLIDQGSEVLIDRLPENDFFYTHIFQKGQTVYSLARTFKTSVSEIYAMNNLSANSSIDVGQTVKVPFALDALYTEKSSSVQSSNKFVPVYYLAQPKETLYRIGKTYFGQDVSTFSKRNKINGTSISIGQKLLIGWLPLSGEGAAIRVNTTIVREEKVAQKEKIEPIVAAKAKKTIEINKEIQAVMVNESVEVDDPIEKMTIEKSDKVERPRREKFITTIVTPESINASEDEVTVPNPSDIKEEIATASEEISDTLAIIIEEPIIEVAPTTRTRRTRGIGIWERDSQSESMAFVLHHTAKKGSTIELYNPQLNLRTKAKVLGRIPLGTYPSDVSVIMSKKVANSLGALDTRFMVELSFVEDIK